MRMRNVILQFPKQFEFRPEIKNSECFIRAKKFVVCGMGGSQLAVELLKSLRPDLDILLHKDYGLPQLPLQGRMVIVSSYSGNTEEALDSFMRAHKQKLPILAISTGGKILDLAEKYKTPYIKLPDVGIQPRCALGFSFLAILKAMSEEKLLKEAFTLAESLNPAVYEKTGKSFAKKLKGFVPVIYASNRNYGLAYNWKIKLNETGKVPAFCNAFPELNHNEMNAFDLPKIMKFFGRNFYFIFLKDFGDSLRVSKRISVLKSLYLKRKLRVTEIGIKGKNRLHAFFASVILADWTSYYTALAYGVDPNKVTMVEEFKKLIK